LSEAGKQDRLHENNRKPRKVAVKLHFSTKPLLVASSLSSNSDTKSAVTGLINVYIGKFPGPRQLLRPEVDDKKLKSMRRVITRSFLSKPLKIPSPHTSKPQPSEVSATSLESLAHVNHPPDISIQRLFYYQRFSLPLTLLR